MEILTLLKANIKKKKGTFISVAFLMVIISAVMVSLISVKDNCQNAVKTALKSEIAFDVRLAFPSLTMTDEMRSVLENSELTDDVTFYDFLSPDSLKKDGNDNYDSDNLVSARSGLKFYKDDFSGYESEPRTINDGEIYAPLGHKSVYKCEIGDKFTAKLGDRTYTFMLKGFVEEPMGGASTFDGSWLFISDGDLDRIIEECKPFETADKSWERVMACVKKSEGYNKSTTKLARELTLELKEKTGYVMTGVLTSDDAYRYTVMVPDLLINMALVFAAFLFVIVLVVMSHSIGAEIETDYVTIGILKSQGFNSGKIRLLFIWRYLLAQSIGMIIGCIVAVPIEKSVSRICMMSTGVLPDKNISVGKAALLMMIILAVCTILILIRTRKAAKISPVRAISCGKEEIYFNSRLQAPISKKVLSASLAFRQMTSGFSRYVGTLCIVGILTFFMITVNLIGNILLSKTAQIAMGLYTPNLEISTDESAQKTPEEIEAAMDEAEKIVDGKEGVYNKLYRNNAMLFYDGNILLCKIYKYPEQMDNILKGRAPRYDNEMLVTELLAEAYDLKIGDKMRLAYKENEEEYIITGFFQKTNNAGMVLGMSFEGADKLGVPHKYLELGYMFDDLSGLDDIKRELDEKLGNTLTTVIYESVDDSGGIAYTALVNAMQAFIYIFSLIFAFVVVRMVVGVCILIYPEMSKQMDGISEAFANMGGFSAAFGMDKLNFGEFIGFFGVECGNVLGLGGAFFAALTGISALSKEEREHTAEFLLTHPVSRISVVTQKLISVIAQIIILNAAAIGVTALSAIIIGEQPEIKPLALTFAAYLIMQIEIAAICFGISAFIGRSGTGFGLGIAAAFYFLNIVANLTESAKVLKYITPFGYTDSADIIADGRIEVGYLAVGIAFTIIGIGAAFWKYGRKDIS